MIEQRAVTARSVRVIMGRIAAVAVAAVSAAIAAEAAVVSEAEAVVFEVVVAVASGTVGRFRSEVTFPTRGPQAQHGVVTSTRLPLEACGRAPKIYFRTTTEVFGVRLLSTLSPTKVSPPNTQRT